jgi:hypothetical protein
MNGAFVCPEIENHLTVGFAVARGARVVIAGGPRTPPHANNGCGARIRTVTKKRDQSRSESFIVPTQLLRYFAIPATSRFSTDSFPAVTPLFHLALTTVRSNLTV